MKKIVILCTDPQWKTILPLIADNVEDITIMSVVGAAVQEKQVEAPNIPPVAYHSNTSSNTSDRTIPDSEPPSFLTWPETDWDNDPEVIKELKEVSIPTERPKRRSIKKNHEGKKPADVIFELFQRKKVNVLTLKEIRRELDVRGFNGNSVYAITTRMVNLGKLKRLNNSDLALPGKTRFKDLSHLEAAEINGSQH